MDYPIWSKSRYAHWGEGGKLATQVKRQDQESESIHHQHQSNSHLKVHNQSKRNSSLISTFSLSILKSKSNQTHLTNPSNTPTSDQSTCSPQTPLSIGSLGEHTPPIHHSHQYHLNKPISIQDEIERIADSNHHHPSSILSNNRFLQPFPTHLFSNNHQNKSSSSIDHPKLQSPIDLPSEPSLSTSSNTLSSSSSSKSKSKSRLFKSNSNNLNLSSNDQFISNTQKFKKRFEKSIKNNLLNSTSNSNLDLNSIDDDSRSSKSCNDQRFHLNQTLPNKIIGSKWDSEFAQFPTTKAALEGVIKYRGVLSKYTTSTQTSFWNLKSSKVWKSVFCCVTGIYPHNHPNLNSSTTLYNLHIFSNLAPNQAELEISRLRLGSESIVCVLEDNMAGESLILKITGYQTDSDGQESISSWMFAMECVNHLKSWMRTFKEIVNELKSAPPPVPSLPVSTNQNQQNQVQTSFKSTISSHNHHNHHNLNRFTSKHTNINPKLGDRDLLKTTKSINQFNSLNDSLTPLPEPDRENEKSEVMALKEAFVKSLQINLKERDHPTPLNQNVISTNPDFNHSRLSSLPPPPRQKTPISISNLNQTSINQAKPDQKSNSIESNSTSSDQTYHHLDSSNQTKTNHPYDHDHHQNHMSSSISFKTTKKSFNRRPSDTNTTTSNSSILDRLPIPRQLAPAPTVALPPLPNEPLESSIDDQVLESPLDHQVLESPLDNLVAEELGAWGKVEPSNTTTTTTTTT